MAYTEVWSEDWLADNRANYTFDEGTSSDCAVDTAAPGYLQGAGSGTASGIKTSAADAGDKQRTTIKFRWKSGAANAAGSFAAIVKRISANNFLMAHATGTAAGPQITIFTRIAGSYAVLVTTSISAKANDTDYWFRTTVEGDVLTAEFFTSDPFTGGTVVHTLSHTLTGSAATTFGSLIAGDGGFRLSQSNTGASSHKIDKVWFEQDPHEAMGVSGGGEFTVSGGVRAEAITVSGGGDMAATGQRTGRVRVAGAVVGDEYRLYDSSNTLLATGTADGAGMATMSYPYASLPVTGYVQGYSGGSPIGGQRFPASGSASIHDDRVFLAHPENLGIGGVDVIDYEGSFYYATSQGGGIHSQIVETAAYRFICYRTGGPGSAFGGSWTDGQIKIKRWDKATEAVDQEFTLVTGIADGHIAFSLAQAPNGKLRFAYGNFNISFRESSSADDVSAWTAATVIKANVSGDNNLQLIFKIGTDGTNYIAGAYAGEKDMFFGKATNAAPTSWTFTTITATANGWFPLLGDMFVAPGASPTRIGIVFGSYKPSFAYEEAYRRIYYVETVNNFSTARKADQSTAVSLPITWDANGDTGADLVQGGYHYGSWCSMVLHGGNPVILADGDRHTYGDYEQVVHWDGSAWTAHDVPGLISNDTGFAAGAPAIAGPRFGTWGVGLVSDGTRLHVYASDHGDGAIDGFRIMRWTSSDLFASAPVDLVVMDDDFWAFSYAELDAGARGSTITGAGLAYPKVPEGYPNTVVFSATDEYDSTVLVASWIDSGTVSVSGGGEFTATGQQTFGETVSVTGGGDMTATGGLTSGGAEPAPAPAPAPLSPLSEVITASHTVAVLVEVLEDGEVVAELETVIDGTVTLDQTAASRGRCDIAIVDDGTLGLIPTDPADQLAPYGNELRISRGVKHPDETKEYVRLGVFRIDSAAVEDTGDRLDVRIAGLDRSARIIDARFEEPYQVAAGTNYADAILAVIQDAYPTVTYDLTATDRTTPQLIAEEGGDRWAFAQDMAKAIGMSLYFDGDGTLVLRPVSSSTSTPVAVLAEGEDGLLVQASRAWSRQGAFNRVIATGENTGETTPARGVATDDNPLSPTYYYGAFGKVPRFYASPFITTDAQAEDAAQAILARELGTTESVDFGAIVDPGRKPDDVVTITRLRAGIDEAHIIDSVTIPLTAEGAMTGKTRAIQVT